MPALSLRAACAALVVLLCACSPSGRDHRVQANETSLKPEADRKPAPGFELKDADGRAVKLSDYKGKVVLLNFWATWCGPCRTEIPWFMDFEQRFKDRGFAVLGVAMDDEGWPVVKPYATEMKMNYRVLLGNDTVGDAYGGVESLPTTFLIDRKGRIASVHVGLIPKSDYENEIKQLLGSERAGRLRPIVPALVVRATN